MAKKDESAAPLGGGTQAGDPAEDYVEITLFQDGERYRDDVFVCVNGETCLVKRGETVRIKRKFADVIAQSMRQDAATARYISDQSKGLNEMERR